MLKFASDVNMEKHNNILQTILEKLKRPWSHNGWDLKDASDNLKIDRDIVMAAVKDDGWNIEFAS